MRVTRIRLIGHVFLPYFDVFIMLEAGTLENQMMIRSART